MSIAWYSRLSRGHQDPINLTIGSVRTLDRLARSIGKQLMIDSAEVARQLLDTTFQAKLGYKPGNNGLPFHPRNLSGVLGHECRRFLYAHAKGTPQVLERRAANQGETDEHDSRRGSHLGFGLLRRKPTTMPKSQW